MPKAPEPVPMTPEPVPAAKPASASNISWEQLITQLPLVGPLRILANHCMAKNISDEQINLVLDGQQAALLTEKNKERLIESITSYFKTKIAVTIEVGKSNIDETPATMAKKAAHEATQKAHESIKNDRNVQAILEQFNGIINTSSIKTKED